MNNPETQNTLNTKHRTKINIKKEEESQDTEYIEYKTQNEDKTLKKKMKKKQHRKLKR